MIVDRPGAVLAGKHELIEKAGAGGMAVVWRAPIVTSARARLGPGPAVSGPTTEVLEDLEGLLEP